MPISNVNFDVHGIGKCYRKGLLCKCCEGTNIYRAVNFSESEILSVLQWALSFIFDMFYFHSLNAYYS